MKVLVLAGTGEARLMCQKLQAAGAHVTASLAGATRAPADLGVTTRVGGFGSAQGFRDYVDEQGFDHVLDATHPFAQSITERSAAVCADMGVAYSLFLRPAWVAGAGDHWTTVASETQAADHIPTGAVVFLATGRQTLHRFANLEGRQLICRQIDPPEGPFPFENGMYLVGRPPFSVADELALFKERSVDWLVVKNAGGRASRTKLDAARHLGIRVIMIERPAPPQGIQISNSITDAVQRVLRG